MNIKKTNVARLLDKANISYELIPYEVDESDLSADHIATQLGEDINCVFKTLVLQGEYPGRNSAASNAAGYFVCVVPATPKSTSRRPHGLPARKRLTSFR